MRLVIAALLLALAALPAFSEEGPPPEITRKELKANVKRFSSDKMQGREGGTDACKQAGEWIAAEFGRLGLEAIGTDGTYFQPFATPKGTKVMPGTALSATRSESGKTTSFKLLEDFAPVDVSANGDVRGEAVFVGYGIQAPSMGYDDYAGLDVKGKVVVALRYAPRHLDRRRSPFAPNNVMMRYGTFKAKADTAHARGAAALIVINSPSTSAKKADDVLRRPGGSTTGKLPVMHMTWRAAKKLGKAIGVPFTRRQRYIDGKIDPRSEACPGVTIHVNANLEPDQRHMRNVVGLLKPDGEVVTGADGKETARARETICIGAHYDHVGLGHFGSLAGGGGKIHNGADDNASGTTALMEIAGYLASKRAALKRRVLFIAFSGEELGLLGSKHYVRTPIVPIADTVAMLNLDMVGRLTKNRLFVGGTGTSPVWPALIERLNKESGKFQLTQWPGGKAPSDHASFYEANMPVLFFFTGLHGDYHRPSDDWNTLNYQGQERVAKFAARVALELALMPQRPQFTRCDAGGFTVGPYTGLAVEQREDGVYVAHVAKKSPARKAGFKVGDKIEEWNQGRIPSTNRYNDVVSKAKPGDRVEVVVLRSGKRKKLKMKLGKT